ncbi:hypothetical protein [Herbidospora galbida]|uniref:hypothetical protein n=1 Tax=Herbidospora galbida TaxID=2575442 RepID=UPI001484DD84|nr:hypothetical protein [Herbidospora galbida]
MRVPSIRRSGRSAALLCAFLLVAACGTEFFPITVRVDPDIVHDIRGIGKVLRETTDEATWENTTEISIVLVVDIGRPGPEGAVGTASGLLRKRGWEASVDGHPHSMWMESRKWPDTEIMVSGVEFYTSPPGLDPDAEKALRSAEAQTGSAGIVMLKLRRTQW